MANNYNFSPELVLAAEDFPKKEFREYHTFSSYENGIIKKLNAHGPVLLSGGRGSGKSALLVEAYLRINEGALSSNAAGIYLSLRHLPLLRSEGKDYELFFCKLLIDAVNKYLEDQFVDTIEFYSEPDIGDLQRALINLSLKLQRRIVLFFDDAAHIGRETSLQEFFDIFRTLSSNSISCKATIYPGVTQFGARFDLLNDATVIDISRNEELPYFGEFFTDLMLRRYSEELPSSIYSQRLPMEKVATFLGRAVTGNVRAFISACNYLISYHKEDSNLTLLSIENTLKSLSTEYYWPLLDELEPKLGRYEPLVKPAREVAEFIYDSVVNDMIVPNYGPSCLIHRDHVERLKKVLEILEYSGFLVKREASRALKSGGRGTRYILNLCSIMESMANNRLTYELLEDWITNDKQYTQLYKGGTLEKIELPDLNESADMGILGSSIEILQKSRAYPYGLTEYRISLLKDAGIETVGELVVLDDSRLYAIHDIGDDWVKRIKYVVGQAIWM